MGKSSRFGSNLKSLRQRTRSDTEGGKEMAVHMNGDKAGNGIRLKGKIHSSTLSIQVEIDINMRWSQVQAAVQSSDGDSWRR